MFVLFVHDMHMHMDALGKVNIEPATKVVNVNIGLINPHHKVRWTL